MRSFFFLSSLALFASCSSTPIELRPGARSLEVIQDDLDTIESTYDDLKDELTEAMHRERFLTYRLLRMKNQRIALQQQSELLDGKIEEQKASQVDPFIVGLNIDIREYIVDELAEVKLDAVEVEQELVVLTKSSITLRKRYDKVYNKRRQLKQEFIDAPLSQD